MTLGESPGAQSVEESSSVDLLEFDLSYSFLGWLDKDLLMDSGPLFIGGVMG